MYSYKFENAKMELQNNVSKVINKIDQFSNIVVIASLGIGFLALLIDGGVITQWIHLICVKLLYGSMVLFVLCEGIASYFFKFTWKCPECKMGLPYYMKPRTRRGLKNKETMIQIDKRRMKSYHPSGSSLVTPRKCPGCGAVFLVKQFNERK